MTIDEWCNNNYSHIVQSAKNISQNSNLAEELAHFAIEQLLTKPNVQEIIDSGGANFWLVRTMLNSWRSTTSSFYTTYRKHSYEIDECLTNSSLIEELVEDEEDMVDILEKELDKLYWYDKELFKLYVDNPNISAIAKETGIPRTSVWLTIDRVKTHLKNVAKRNDI